MFKADIFKGEFMNKNIKVAIGADAFPPTIDGISNMVQSYADILNRQCCEAVVVTPKNPNKQDEKYNYKIYRYKSWYFPNKEEYSYGWPFRKSLSMDLVNMNFDILHSHVPIATSYFFRCVNRIKRIPHVLTWHTKYERDLDTRIGVKAAKDFAYHFISNNINSADEIWVTSEGSVQSLRKFGYTGDYVLMPNGCDMPKKCFSQEEIDSLKESNNIPKNVPLLIYVGRMIWYKNIRLTLDACKKLKDSGRDFRLVMIGFGQDENDIQKYYKELDIEDKVIWKGKILDRVELQKYYGAADLLVFPSTFDTNGLVVREAASCATPAVLVKDSCAAEGIEDNETGFLCEENADSLADRLSEIIDNKELLDRTGKNAQEKIYISREDSVKRAYERYKIVIENFYKEGKDKEKYIY